MTSSPNDAALNEACAIVERAQRNPLLRPSIKSFFDIDTFTVSHLIRDPGSRACAVIDSVLNFDQASGRTRTISAQAIIDTVQVAQLEVQWLLETHVHADHLSAAPELQKHIGGRVGIGKDVTVVQQMFAQLFNEGAAFARDGSQFDHLLVDGERFTIGALEAIALHVPGHTPACMAYVIGDAVFPGDTLFMPDYGTARCDFPGGSAAQLYRSIRRLLHLPETTRVFLCHDYKASGRDVFTWQTTIGAERRDNIHIREGVRESDFVKMREARDATLSMPKLLLPSVQVNMRAGRMPEPEYNGVRYLKLPIDAI